MNVGKDNNNDNDVGNDVGTNDPNSMNDVGKDNDNNVGVGMGNKWCACKRARCTECDECVTCGCDCDGKLSVRKTRVIGGKQPYTQSKCGYRLCKRKSNRITSSKDNGDAVTDDDESVSSTDSHTNSLDATTQCTTPTKPSKHTPFNKSSQRKTRSMKYTPATSSQKHTPSNKPSQRKTHMKYTPPTSSQKHTPSNKSSQRKTHTTPQYVEVDEDVDDFKIPKVSSICKYYDLPLVMINNFPSAMKREDNFADIPIAMRKSMVYLCVKVCDALCKFIMPNDPSSLYNAVASELNGNDVAVHEKLYKTIISMQDALPGHSQQQKVLLAALGESMNYRSMKEITGSNIGLKSIRKSKMHYRMIISGLEIPPPVRSVSRYNAQCVEKAVEYILSPEQMKTLSWGTNTFSIDGEEITFPHESRVHYLEHSRETKNILF